MYIIVNTSMPREEITANLASQPVPAAAAVRALHLVTSDHAPVSPLPPAAPAPGPGPVLPALGGRLPARPGRGHHDPDLTRRHWRGPQHLPAAVH